MIDKESWEFGRNAAAEWHDRQALEWDEIKNSAHATEQAKLHRVYASTIRSIQCLPIETIGREPGMGWSLSNRAKESMQRLIDFQMQTSVHATMINID